MHLVRIAQSLKENRRTIFTARGNSMTPLIRDGDRVLLIPVVPGAEYEIGTIVLARVKGRYYLHKIVHVTSDGKYVIGNNKGHTNGIASEIVGEFAGFVRMS